MWIKCKDKLPPMEHYVLVSDGKLITVAHRGNAFHDGTWQWWETNYDLWDGDDITHWQELPSLPSVQE